MDMRREEFSSHAAAPCGVSPGPSGWGGSAFNDTCLLIIHRQTQLSCSAFTMTFAITSHTSVLFADTAKNEA